MRALFLSASHSFFFFFSLLRRIYNVELTVAGSLVSGTSATNIATPPTGVKVAVVDVFYITEVCVVLVYVVIDSINNRIGSEKSSSNI